VQGFIVAVTDTMVPGQSVYAKPTAGATRCQSTSAPGANNANRTFLFTRAYEYLRSYWPNEAPRRRPLFYADYDYTHWLIAPTPDQAYPFEVLYYELPQLLDDTVQTNWLTEYAPQLLLYGTLLEATPFLKNDERIATLAGLLRPRRSDAQRRGLGENPRPLGHPQGSVRYDLHLSFRRQHRSTRPTCRIWRCR
jgi:hypothetical protein